MDSCVVDIGDHTIHYWHRPASGPALVFFHATGFHARVWDKVAGQFPEYDVYQVDMPGHGLSSAPALPFRWDCAGEALAGLVRQLDLHDVTGVGHSMGGHVLLLAAAENPDRFRQLLVLDPVVLPRKAISFMNGFDTSALARRRNEWSSAEAFYNAYQDRAPFDSWDRDVLRDYAEHALVETDECDGFVLACNPDLEASVYQNHGAAVLHERFAEITCPVHIMRARSLGPGDSPTDFRLSPTAPTLVNKLPHATDRQFNQFTHFFPMEEPAWLSEELGRLLG